MTIYYLNTIHKGPVYGFFKFLFGFNELIWGSEIRPFEIRKCLKSRLFEVEFQMVLFSNGRALEMALVMAIAIVPTIRNPHIFIQISKFLTTWLPFVWISNGVLSFRSHSKFGPFAAQHLINHSKSRLVQILDPHCIENWTRIRVP